MARPKSQDKRRSILAAAIEVIAEQGLSVPTSKIARVAGVSEGSLFTYFETKDTLLNELYLELKAEVRANMLVNYPAQADLKVRARHLWDQYVRLGISHPDKYKVITQLSVSHHIWEQSKRRGMEGYEAVHAMIQELFAYGALKDQPFEFGTALLLSLMNMTIEFIAQHPSEAERFWDAGFTAFWNAVTAP
ncbi:TetR/AcrR family transcriptional regulator [Ktedonosporobacter rubrisoli]|uniref:TetR/AcrR family transcriptional regulator n=1 Tax=Ktedonosporobacter rubrisoli TaxID=2509675 RepID=A0A4P6JTQ2_KTERU|nr:TetR/AcrR family transcriptional regulator [Ktedonosporobacter rubrisoli]QBD78958.1 TetR/AcrR family transcriptional regulator [Ktedonosporobacter rubrisoli]